MLIEDGWNLAKRIQKEATISEAVKWWYHLLVGIQPIQIYQHHQFTDACDNISAVLKQRFLFWPYDGALRKHAVLTSPLAINWESTKVACCESPLPSEHQKRYKVVDSCWCMKSIDLTNFWYASFYILILSWGQVILLRLEWGIPSWMNVYAIW